MTVIHRPHLRAITALLAMPLLALPIEPVQAAETNPSLELTFDHRSRVEHVDGQTLATRTGSDRQANLRTGLRLELDGGDWFGVLDIVDARAVWHPDDTRISTANVNTVEPVEALIGWRGRDLFADGSSIEVRLGRQTLDLGSRRLVARNAWRNTTNAFVGLGAQWRLGEVWQAQLFAFSPLFREPFLPAELRDDQWELDEGSMDRRFLGGWLGWRSGRARRDIHLLYLDERDEPGIPTSDRELWTLAGHLAQTPAPGRWDWELEGAVQWGESRATALGIDTSDLDHFAHFQHAEIGYTLEGEAGVRLALELDHASGDEDPTDGDNGRFDHLFGAAVGDLGPRSLFNAFSRTNLVLTGASASWKMPAALDGFVRVRGAWLAEERDFWAGTGLIDPSGDADPWLGVQSEFRLRWRPRRSHWQAEMALAHLAKGDYVDAPGLLLPADDSDVLYGYVEIRFTL